MSDPWDTPPVTIHPHLPDQEIAKPEGRALRERIAAADRIHHRHAHNDICDSRPWAPCDADDACEHDGEQWPCPTHTALHPEDSRA